MLQATDTDIAYAQKILLPNGKIFDQERVDFIKNFTTLDLQAVPGSGKTTALLAKLLIIERYLPFNDSSGVLVISHTNAAVDEIKAKIEKHCPKLFAYPNFIGTIQNFVDEFLAVPYSILNTGGRPERIDNDIFLAQFHRACPVPTSIALGARYGNNLDSFLLKLGARTDRDYIFDNLADSEIATRFSKTTQTYQNLRSTKIQVLNDGYLNFNDAYFLANRYLEIYPRIKYILRKRFSHVFVDEMQDMDTHQYELLEKVFIGGTQPSADCFQRIGDKNQAIFNGDAADRDVWQDRETVLKFNGSHRLSPKNAKIVQNFALHPITVRGLKTNNDGSEVDIPPHVIVYDNATINRVTTEFARVAKDLRDAGRIPLAGPYYVIGWNTKWSDDEATNRSGNVRLIDYYPTFTPRTALRREVHDTLEDHLISSLSSSLFGLKPFQDSIIQLIIRTLNLEGVRTSDDRPFTKTTLLHYLAENAEDDTNETLRRNLYAWSIGLAKYQFNDVTAEIRAYLPEICSVFGASCTASSNAFINTQSQQSIAPPAEIDIEEASEEFELIAGTVHSVKGQTHAATLYVETYRGANSPNVYESQRLAGQFKGEPYARRSGALIKQSAKMIYVGMSRPTHLLCFAVHKDRFDSEAFAQDWQIIDITN